jgi:hypothetical protein
MGGGPYKHRKDKDARHRDQVVLGLRVCGPLSGIKRVLNEARSRILEIGMGDAIQASLNAVSLDGLGRLGVLDTRGHETGCECYFDPCLPSVLPLVRITCGGPRYTASLFSSFTLVISQSRPPFTVFLVSYIHNFKHKH